ncbi:hypothetical protein AB0J72_13745 [Dactylosporangium sp. NPDC049742]|uniref:hypothetical protein n=1 Tax=Dactylosporangium sp. NPDC049742 TaxID=3154737 RepID=UPI00342FAD5A
MSQRRSEVAAPRLARGVVAVLGSGVVSVLALDLASSVEALPELVGGLAILAAHGFLLARNVLGVARPWWPRALAVQAVLTYLPLAVWPHLDSLRALTAFLAGTCLIRLRPPHS